MMMPFICSYRNKNEKLVVRDGQTSPHSLGSSYLRVTQVVSVRALSLYHSINNTHSLLTWLRLLLRPYLHTSPSLWLLTSLADLYTMATFNEQAKAIMTCDLRRQSCVRRVTEQGVCCFMIGTRFSNLYTAVDTPAEAMVDRELCSKSESDL